MPAAAGPSNGPVPSVSAVPLRFGELSFGGGGGSTVTGELFADGLPGLRAWFLQTVGAGLVTVQLQFADGNIPGSVDWQPLVPAYGIILLVPSLAPPYGLGSRRFRASITSTGVATVRYRLSGSIV